MLDFEFIRENWQFIAGGVGETLGISVLAFLLAILLGLIFAMGLRSTFLPLKAISAFCTAIIDATPLLLQIFFIFLALPQMGIFMNGLMASALVLGINYGARLSRLFHPGFIVGKNDKRNARSSLIPALGEEFVSMIKDSALIGVTGFAHEILWRATRAGRAEFKNLEAFLLAAVFYWVLTFIPVFVLRMRGAMQQVPESGADGYV